MVKENCQHTPNQNFKKQRKIKLQHATWESPRKNCGKKAHHKIKKKHHIAVPSGAWRSIFSGDQRCLNHSTDLHNISLSLWWPLWEINSFSLEAIWISHILHYSKFLFLTALINIFLLTFCSHKTCYKSFAIPIAYKGYDGCPSHHKFPQAKLKFPLDLPKKHQPLSSSRTPWNSHTLLFLLIFDFSHIRRSSHENC